MADFLVGLSDPALSMGLAHIYGDKDKVNSFKRVHQDLCTLHPSYQHELRWSDSSEDCNGGIAKTA